MPLYTIVESRIIQIFNALGVCVNNSEHFNIITQTRINSFNKLNGFGR